MSRTHILKKVKTACRSLRARDELHGSQWRNTAETAKDNGVAASGTQLSGSQGHLLAQFEKAAGDVGVHVQRIEDINELADAIGAVVSKTGTEVQTLRVGTEQWRERLAPLTASGVTLHVGAGGTDDDAALSEAICAIADSGSVVLASRPECPTSLAFLPTVHLVVVDVNTLVATLTDAMLKIGETLQGGRHTRAINIITGASRTGDLGGKIVAGAHGPKHLGVIVCGS